MNYNNQYNKECNITKLIYSRIFLFELWLYVFYAKIINFASEQVCHKKLCTQFNKTFLSFYFYEMLLWVVIS